MSDSDKEDPPLRITTPHERIDKLIDVLGTWLATNHQHRGDIGLAAAVEIANQLEALKSKNIK